MHRLDTSFPRLQVKRGPKTKRGKFNASRNATKYAFSNLRTKIDQDRKLFDTIKSALVEEADDEICDLDLEAIAAAMIKAYFIRSDVEATTLKLVRAQLEPIEREAGPTLKHLEGLRRYERRARSRLMTLSGTRPDRKTPGISDVIRRIVNQDRLSS